MKHRIKRVLKKLMLRLRGWSDIEDLKARGMNVGDGCWFGDGCSFDYSFPHLISIGNNVTLSHNVDLIVHDASLQKGLRVTRLGLIKIGDNAFLGANSTVLPGVTIGDGAVVGAGSLVNRDIPTEEVWGGCPARFICTVYELKSKHELLLKSCRKFDSSYTYQCGVNEEMKQEMIEVLKKDGTAYME